MNHRTITLGICAMLATAAFAQKVESYTSTQQNGWEKQKVEVSRNISSKAIELNKNDKAQEVKGIGGCFNEMGWDALQILPAERQQEVINALFSPDGVAFDYCRIPLGANDFSLSYYSYDDTADDFGLQNFNISRDRYILIPYIKAAMKVNPSLRVWASPWTPPAWMKTNNHYASTPHDKYNGLPKERAIADKSTGFKMQDGYLSTYADYFVKFINAYADEGIKISAVCPQNEPCSNQIFPSCKWRPEDLVYFVGRYLGPTFEKNNVDADIIFGTINTSDPNYVRTAMNDADASKYVNGAGFQWDGKKAIPVIHEEYPDLMLMQTETECGDGHNSWDYAEYTWDLMRHYFVNGANSYNYWNMILPRPGVSPWGWNQNSMVTIDKATKEVTFNPEYYLMKQLSHNVRTGAYRLNTPADSDMIAFENPDGSVAVIMGNRTDNENPVEFALDGKNYSTVLRPHSFTSILIK